MFIVERQDDEAESLEPERFCARCGERVHEEVVYHVPGCLGALGAPLKSLGLAGAVLGLFVVPLFVLLLGLVGGLGGEGGFAGFLLFLYSAQVGAVCLLVVFPIGLLLSQEKSRSYRCPACGHVGHKALRRPRGSRRRR